MDMDMNMDVEIVEKKKKDLLAELTQATQSCNNNC